MFSRLPGNGISSELDPHHPTESIAIVSYRFPEVELAIGDFSSTHSSVNFTARNQFIVKLCHPHDRQQSDSPVKNNSPTSQQQHEIRKQLRRGDGSGKDATTPTPKNGCASLITSTLLDHNITVIAYFCLSSFLTLRRVEGLNVVDGSKMADSVSQRQRRRPPRMATARESFSLCACHRPAPEEKGLCFKSRRRNSFPCCAVRRVLANFSPFPHVRQNSG